MSNEFIEFMIFLREWLDDDEWIDDYSDEYLEYLVGKWKNEWLPCVEAEHNGDCTNHPWVCMRCQMDNIRKNSERVIAAFKKAKGE